MRSTLILNTHTNIHHHTFRLNAIAAAMSASSRAESIATLNVFSSTRYNLYKMGKWKIQAAQITGKEIEPEEPVMTLKEQKV